MNRVKVLGMSLLACGAMMTVSHAKAQASDGDKQFLATAAQGDMNEIKLSKLAETKASSPEVKAFAHKMVADHTALESKMKPFAMKWGLTPPSGMDSDHQAEYDKLNGMSGAEFDHEYMQAMDKDHHQALNLFTQEASSTKDAKFRAAVMNGKSVVSSHTHMADSLSAKS